MISRMKPILFFLMVVGVLAGVFTANADESSANGLLLVANKGDHTLGLIDTDAGKMIATVTEDGVTGHEVVASPDGKRAFVPIYGNAGVGRAGTDGQLIRVVDLEKRAVVGTIDLGKSLRPHCAVIGPKNGLLYVTTELENSITVIDPQTNGVSQWIEMPGIGYGSATTPDGRWLVIALFRAEQVAVIDLATMKVAHTVDVPAAPQEVLVRPDGAEAYVSCDASRQIAVIDTKEWKVKKLIDAGPGADGLAWAKGK